MLLISVGLGILAAAAGYYLAFWLDGSIAGAIATITGIEFMLALLFSPSRGLLLKRRQVQPV